MIRLVFFFLSSFSWVFSIAQMPFQKLYNNGAEFAQALGACPTPDDGTAFTGIVDIPGQASQAFVTQLNCNGDLAWTRLLGNSSTIDNIFPNVRADSEGRIWFTANIGVWNNYDGIIGCFSADGTLLQAKRFGTNGRNDQLYGLQLGPDGSVYVCGLTNSWGADKTGNAAFHDLFVARLDANLNVIWTRTIGNKNNIDTGFDLALDLSGNVLVTGRYIVNGTFFGCLLKLNAQGDVLTFKGYGESSVPHRTYGYGVTATKDGHYLLTGSTTIDKQNHQSTPDVYLIKTDLEGNPIFEQIFIPTLGTDNSESGSSVIEMHDGRYGIGVPTMSFTTFTQGFVPNKNAVFVTEPDGVLSEARIYNQGGSHYTKLYNRPSGYLLSNFSNFYSVPNPGSGPFRPLIINTDNQLQSGCNEIDVTPYLAQVQHPWEAVDISFELDTNALFVPYTVSSLFSFQEIQTLCEVSNDLFATVSISDTVCVGELVSLSADTSGQAKSVLWELGDGTIIEGQIDTHYTYQEPGVYQILFRMESACSAFEVLKEIVVQPAVILSESVGLCSGDTLYIGEQIIVSEGLFSYFLAGTNCDTVVNVTVSILPVNVTPMDTLLCEGDSILLGERYIYTAGVYLDTVPGQPCKTIFSTTITIEPCACAVEFPNVFTPNRDQTNDQFGPVITCNLELLDYELKIFNRWGREVFKTLDPNIKWDGSLNGQDLPSDVYAWVASYAYAKQDTILLRSKRGDITLLR